MNKLATIKTKFMKKNTTLIFILIIGCFIQSFGQNLFQEKIRPMSRDTLIEITTQTMYEYNIPGIAVSVFTGDTILNIEVMGVRRLNSNDSIKLNDRFHLGSNGKPMTSFVAGRLVEKGIIKWDTKFFDVFPELIDSSNSAYRNITLKDLLSHQSRVRPFTDEDEFAVLPEFPVDSGYKRRYAFTKWLMKQPLVELGGNLHELDSIMKFTYSNAGYAVAALMMEKITGKEWEDLINDELFKPLNIKASFGWPALTDNNQPWGHWIKDGDSVLTPHSPNDSYKLDKIICPAGDYSMSILDHTKFLQINLIGLSGKDTLLKSSTYHFMHYCNIDKNEPASVRYSIGWFVRETKGGHIISAHNGSAGTFLSRTMLNSEKGLGLIVEANSCDEKPIKGLKKLTNRINEYYNIQ